VTSVPRQPTFTQLRLECASAWRASWRRCLTDPHGKLAQMGRVDTDGLGDATVAVAREDDLAPEIAAVIGFRVRRVRRQLERTHGSTLVRNAFVDAWPAGEAEDGSEADSSEELGDTTVAVARDDGLAPQIAKLTGLRTSDVRATLDEAHGRALVHNIFDEDWPVDVDDGEEAESDDDLDALGV
jgi:hypothetical protein